MRHEWEMIVTEIEGTPVYISGFSKADCLRNFAGMANDFKNILTIKFRMIAQ